MKEKLMKISPATIDRSLKNDKMKFGLNERLLTKPGTILKQQISMRTFAGWNEKAAGFGTCTLPKQIKTLYNFALKKLIDKSTQELWKLYGKQRKKRRKYRKPIKDYLTVFL